MQQSVDSFAASEYARLDTALEEKQAVIETELAERSLKQGLFGKLASNELARTVAWEMVSMLRISLVAGDFSQFRRQIEWEIRVALSHHQLFKLESDLALLDLLREILTEQLDTSLADEVRSLIMRLGNLFSDCWEKARQEQTLAERLN